MRERPGRRGRVSLGPLGRTVLVSCVLAVLAALAACGDPSIEGDTFPILVDRAAGAFVVDVREDGVQRRAVVDVMSPLTVVDVPAGTPVQRRGATLTVLGHRSETDPTLIARAILRPAVLELRPCASDAPCKIGGENDEVAIEAVIGADALRGAAIRFQPAVDRLAILPDVAGDSGARDRACDAEVPRPFYGGGTLQVGGTELAFAGLRIALGVCLSPDPTATSDELRGTDAALVLSTGLGISIIGEARYEAWRRVTNGPALESLAEKTALLPSGEVRGRLARFDRLAIVGTSTAPRGACRTVYAHHLLAERDCAPGDDCPCTSGDRTCATPAILELAPGAPIEAIVVPDRHPLLQALRTELRPEQPEIDGILGVDALATTELDVDYPNNRLLLRCVGAGCVARPAFRDVGDRSTIATCISAAPTP